MSVNVTYSVAVYSSPISLATIESVGEDVVVVVWSINEASSMAAVFVSTQGISIDDAPIPVL